MSAAYKLYVLIIGQFSGQLHTLFVCQDAGPGLPGGERLDVIFQGSQWRWCQLKSALDPAKTESGIRRPFQSRRDLVLIPP